LLKKITLVFKKVTVSATDTSISHSKLQTILNY